ncbi:MAG: sugar ABC transporter substrate-binding protein [Acetobacter sp.]|uniref:sugar ABC transporter substrate-binding protein n=1 Tax=Acetobacter sp. TaxID=440 RepID=UPI0039EBF782
MRLVHTCILPAGLAAFPLVLALAMSPVMAAGIARGSAPPLSPTGESGAPVAEQGAAGQEVTGQERTVTDMAGAAVMLRPGPTPIADLWFAHNEITVMLGAAGRIVVSAENPKDRPWLFRIAPVLLRAETGIKPDSASAEDLLARHVGLVFVPSRARAEDLRRTGLPALAADYMTLPDMLRSLDMTAQAIGTAQAAETARLYRQKMDAVTTLLHQRLASVAMQDRPRVLHIARLDPLQIDGTGTLIDAWIQAAGGRNAATVGGNHRPVTFEQIAVWNPDVVIIDSGAGDIAASSPLHALAAYRNARWWRSPRGVFAWDRYGAEVLLQLQWAAQHLHPTLFADLDIPAATRDFYRTFFHYTLTADETARILAAQPPPAP